MSVPPADSARLPVLTRRRLLQGGGVLMVGVALYRLQAAGPVGRSLNPAMLNSWIEIRPDNTVLLRTGNSDFGQGTVFTAYRQIVAEELNMSIEAITTIVTGDTDRTPDGGGSYGFLEAGSPNVRKAAAYTYQALLDLGAERLGVPREKLLGEDGAFSVGGRRVTYGDLVKGRDLTLTISVQERWPAGMRIVGDPPTKPVSQYKIIGKSIDNSAIKSKVSATEQWVTDVRLPEMWHARIVRPATLGSKLVSAGAVDSKAFPAARIVVKGDLVAVVSPDEWEASQAALQVAGDTKWTEWQGLPTNAGLYETMRKADWASTPVQKGKSSKEGIRPLLDGAARTLKATYQVPYMKHAPIGPTMAVADVRDDVTTVYTHTQNAQMLRRQIAQMLGVGLDEVVIRTFAGPGHYGRSNGGNAGAEDEAVILSKELGRPVRVQWTRAEDMQWSTQSPAAFSDIEIGLDAKGRMIAFQVDHHMPAMNDNRLIGAVLAGLPTLPPPTEKPPVYGKSTLNLLWDRWTYEGTTEIMERAHGTRQIGQDASPLAIGLRDHSMRSPGQFQQNFARELAISEAAALAGADPLEFRIRHATDPRVVGVLEAVRDAAGWQPRPSPAPDHASDGDRPVRGRGVSMLYRLDSYWASVCEISLVPSTGVVTVERCVVAVDPGIVINPKQLQRQVEGGVTMGLSQALKEEVMFDQSGVTATDWAGYPILTMAEMPEIKVVLLNRPEVGCYGGGSEGGNVLAAPAIAAAIHDATGKILRRFPFTPANVLPVLGSG
ncbi:xanthine dehydrogenase family protein molybdopterin-binding subunit [Sphingobium sp. TB-6]|uniref:xanthine dehydrogenase family protein molybdopterin-binding subunit n=1 Tax=Sphingobium sp. TB-6 TaxID=2728850 RepID=UPI00146E4284|nr:molybdopterin cofactor-binding domain-containing protein [Sphingobium sp. TB-6]NML87654.1 xanthine dehydrogenase family protein molybdopterin-binding subunit [Sphingobium sp. TB-6]